MRHQLVKILTLWVAFLYSIGLTAAVGDSLVQKKFIDRFSIHTNTVGWVFTVPNVGIEFDLKNSTENQYSLLLEGRYNWNTQHDVNPSNVFNMSGVSLEARKYWRTGGTIRGPFSKYSTRDTTISRFRWMFVKFRRNVLSGRTLSNPRTWRAYYVGLYTGYDRFSFAYKGKGIQGAGYNLGVTGGWSIPLYLLKGGRSIDLDLGITLAAKYAEVERYRYDEESACYAYQSHKDWHFVPFPVIQNIRVGLAYRFRSIGKKVMGGPERYEKWDDAQIAKRTERRREQDAERERDKHRKDSLQKVRLAEEKLKQFRKDSVRQAKQLADSLERIEKENARKLKKAKKNDKKSEDVKEEKTDSIVSRLFYDPKDRIRMKLLCRESQIRPVDHSIGTV